MAFILFLSPAASYSTKGSHTTSAAHYSCTANPVTMPSLNSGRCVRTLPYRERDVVLDKMGVTLRFFLSGCSAIIRGMTAIVPLEANQNLLGTVNVLQ